MDKTVLSFIPDRETKRTWRYTEASNGTAKDAADAVVGNIYVKKSVLGDAVPEMLTVTIEEG